jgi:hypothetical protein
VQLSRDQLQLVIGAGGALLIATLFMPWASGLSGWETFTTTDLFLLIVGSVALAAAVTGGRVGVFRPDVSLNGAADLLSLVAVVLIVWFLFFDFPDGADREAGGLVALVAAIAIAAAAGDYGPTRGAPWFPRLRG